MSFCSKPTLFSCTSTSFNNKASVTTSMTYLLYPWATWIVMQKQPVHLIPISRFSPNILIAKAFTVKYQLYFSLRIPILECQLNPIVVKNTPASYFSNPTFKSWALRPVGVPVLPLNWHGSTKDEATTPNSLFTGHLFGVIVKYMNRTLTITWIFSRTNFRNLQPSSPLQATWQSTK